MRRTLATALALGVFTLLARPAHAEVPPCETLPDEPVPATPITKIYIENGDTQEPLIQRLGKLLINSTAGRLRIIYRNRPTCALRDDLFASKTMTTVQDGATLRPVKYIPVDGSAPVECSVPPAGDGNAKPIQLGIGATYLSSCAMADQPADIDVREGPTQAYGFITHPDSHQVAITAEEGYFALAFPEGGGEAAPWTVQSLRFRRAFTASTTLTMASAIRIAAGDMQATQLTPDKSENIATTIGTDPASKANPDATLGILGAELYDASFRDVVKFLAFKAWGQKFAYYPDKTDKTRDKQNVRDGHYLPWAPTQYILKTSGGTAVFPDAERVYQLVMGTAVADDVDGIGQVTASGLVPKCAMKVKRAGDGQDLELYSDPEPCNCYFEKNVPGGATSCTACTGDTCGTGKTCSHGFCEVTP